MMEIYASDQTLLHVGLERGNAEHESDLDGIIELLAAVGDLTRGWLKPLGVGFQLVYCDVNEYFTEVGYPPTPHHFLRQSDVPDELAVREAYSDSVVEQSSDVSAETMHQAIARGLTQPAREGIVTTLSELKWTAVQVLAPTLDPIELMVVGRPARSVTRLIDGQRWYFGPALLGTAGPPVRLRAVNDHFVTRIQLDVFWDLWIGHSEGRAMLEAGVRCVLDRPGWERLGSTSH